MEYEFIDVFCSSGDSECVTKGVFQYDRGLKLRIHGLANYTSVDTQFGVDGIIQTLRVIPTIEEDCFVSDIPDVLLTQRQPIQCFVCTYTNDVTKTIAAIKTPVIPRAKPSSYEFTEEELDQYNAIMSSLGNALQETEKAQQDAEGALQQANKISEEFEQVKEQVNRIEEAVKEVGGSVGSLVFWDSIENKPESFPPSEHMHDVDDIEGLAEAIIGGGTVKSVNDISPDAAGNIHLEADDVNALTVDLDEGYVTDENLVKSNTELFAGRTFEQAKVEILEDVPVTSVNEKTGAVVLTAADVGAKEADWVPAIADIEGLGVALQQAGKVKTVNLKHPDNDGNIAIDAKAVGAREATWIPSIEEISGLKEALDNAGQVKSINSTLKPDLSGNVNITAKDVGALYVNEDNKITNGEEDFIVNADKVNDRTVEEIYEYIIARLDAAGYVKKTDELVEFTGTVKANKVIGAVYA